MDTRLGGRPSRMAGFVLLGAVFFLIIQELACVPPMSGGGEATGQPTTPVVPTAEEVADVLRNDPAFLAMIMGEPGPQGPEGPPGGVSDLDHGQLTGLDADDHPQYVMHGEPDSVTNPMIADGAVTLSKLDAAGPANGLVLKTDGAGMVWAMDETGPKASVEFVESASPASIALTTAEQTVAQVTINAPASGKVHVIGNLTIDFQTGLINGVLVGKRPAEPFLARGVSWGAC